MDGILSPFKKAIGWVVGKGNTPGTPETRKYGYSPTEVSALVNQNIQSGQHLTEPATVTTGDTSKALLYSGIALGAVLLLNTMGGSRRGRN